VPHDSPWIAGLRSAAVEVPDLTAAEDFYTRVWNLSVADRGPSALFLRGSGPDHHLLALHEGETAAIRHVTLRARSRPALDAIAAATAADGGRLLTAIGPVDDPAGGTGLTIADGDGRIIQVVHEDRRHAGAPESPDAPIRLAHVVLNSHHLDETQRFFERALGFSLSDRTRIMAFMRCNRDHHSVALGDSDNDALNHIAFMMCDVDAVMRGGGRMRDAGYPIEWGPGRHGPGNNAFTYFVDPFGVAIEYTADVQQVDDSYKAGGPDDWRWPEGRVDQWGIGHGPTPRLKQVQKQVRFVPEVRP
jgi:catechol 2,3-dioxygenase